MKKVIGKIRCGIRSICFMTHPYFCVGQLGYSHHWSLTFFFSFFYFVCRAATKKVPFWVGSLVLWKNWRKWREAKVKPRLDPLPRIPITLSLQPLVPLQNQGTTKIMNKLRQGQKTRTKIKESKERKIKASISLVLLRKGPESIAHWRKRTGRRRFLDCLIKTNWTSTPICSITLISSYALCYIFRSISLVCRRTRWNIFKLSGDTSMWWVYLALPDWNRVNVTAKTKGV